MEMKNTFVELEQFEELTPEVLEDDRVQQGRIEQTLVEKYY